MGREISMSSMTKKVLVGLAIMIAIGGMVSFAAVGKVRLPKFITMLMTTDGGTAPVLTPDRRKYHPGETATVTGSGFTPGAMHIQTYQGEITDPTPTIIDDRVDITADASGGFTYSFTFPSDSKPGSYNIVATDSIGLTATVRIIDPPGVLPATDMNWLQMDGNLIMQGNDSSATNLAITDWASDATNSTTPRLFDGSGTTQ